jgi:hypothetical protein
MLTGFRRSIDQRIPEFGNIDLAAVVIVKGREGGQQFRVG